jgi:hypothetical protein
MVLLGAALWRTHPCPTLLYLPRDTQRRYAIHLVDSTAGESFDFEGARSDYILHMVAVCQAGTDAQLGTYYRKKLVEGKSCKEALRSFIPHRPG